MFETILKKMVLRDTHSPASLHPNPRFALSPDNLATAERRLGFELPSQLRIFAAEVGCGFFKTADPETDVSRRFHINRFLAPSQIANMLLDPEDPANPSEGFDPGEIPFFEVGDQYYLTLKPTLTLPNGVYAAGELICKDLMEFTERLSADARFYAKG